MSDRQYDPQSHDAVLSRILANQENMAETLRVNGENLEIQIREHRAETSHGFATINERVGVLERFRANLRGKVAVVSGGIGLATTGLFEWAKNHFTSGNGSGH